MAPTETLIEQDVISWDCPHCRRSNPVTSAKCSGCGKMKPVDSFIDIGDLDLDPKTKAIVTNAVLDGDFEIGHGGPLKVPQTSYKRSVKKVVEVPVSRKVKVPTVTPQIVDTEEVQRVKVRRHVMEPGYKWVEEAYTDIEEKPATRMKEVWIKKLVPEQYMKKVEVRKTRQVKVPTTVTREVEGWADITVPATKVVNVPGYRIDEVKDTKLMEIEGWQEIELVPRVKDKIRIERTRVLDEDRHRRVERKIGHELLLAEEADRVDVDTDSQPSDRPGVFVTTGPVVLDGTEQRSTMKRSRQFMRSVPRVVRTIKSAPVFEETTWENEVFAMFHFTLANHPNGLMIVEVKPGGYAEQYRMRVGEIIRNADGRPITCLRDWRTVLRSKTPNSDLRLVILSKQGETRHVKVALIGYDPRVYRQQLGDTIMDTARSWG